MPDIIILQQNQTNATSSENDFVCRKLHLKENYIIWELGPIRKGQTDCTLSVLLQSRGYMGASSQSHHKFKLP